MTMSPTPSRTAPPPRWSRSDRRSTPAPLLARRRHAGGADPLGAAARRAQPREIVAVTGSVGKTGTKEALRAALGACGAVSASAGSLNNHWGVPLSLAAHAARREYGVFELGMNHPGEIAALTRLVRPHVAVITTIEPAHLGYFPSVEAIADAKAEIFDGARARRRRHPQPRQSAISRASRWRHRARHRAHHRLRHASRRRARLIECSSSATAARSTAAVMGERIDYRLGFAGRHWVMNSLAVLAAVKARAAMSNAAAAALAASQPLPGRGRRHELASARRAAFR